MEKRRIVVLASSVFGVAAGALLLVQACRTTAPDAAAAERGERTDRTTPAESPATVRLAPVAAGPVDRPIRGTGTLRMKSEADLSFKVGGVVSAVLVEEGARVKKGQLLARLDPTEVDAALRQAKEASLKAERDLDRVKRLHAGGALPIADLQNAETSATLSRAAVDAAAFNAQRSAILAPDDGRVDRRMVEPGEIVAPGRPVLRVSGRSRGAVVRMALVDRDVLRVREGDEAVVVLDARPDRKLPGKVAQIATVATPGIGTFDVEVRLDALDAPGASSSTEAAESASLLSGLTAKVEIRHAEAVAGIVPIGALAVGRGADASVFTVEGARARRVPVKVAFLMDGRAALAAGPDVRSHVVESGAAQLEDGMPVRVLP